MNSLFSSMTRVAADESSFVGVVRALAMGVVAVLLILLLSLVVGGVTCVGIPYAAKPAALVCGV